MAQVQRARTRCGPAVGGWIILGGSWTFKWRSAGPSTHVLPAFTVRTCLSHNPLLDNPPLPWMPLVSVVTAADPDLEVPPLVVSGS